MGKVILEMKNISKGFPGVQALDKVQFDLREGEVHALMGENGAGKSTLMKVLTGIYQKDEGEVIYQGKPVSFHNTSDSLGAGISMVHQELNTMNHLTVAKNIWVGREPVKGLFIDDEKMVEDSRKLFETLNVDIDPRSRMGDLTVGKQQMCEIAKAISYDAKLIVFDEPSAALTESEIEELFKVIRSLREKDIAMIYITHRMDEVGIITDRVTVMRDGEYVGTKDTKDLTKNDIIQMMVGRVVYEDPKTASNVPADAPVILDVRNLNAGRMVKDVSFTLRKGEILGFSGLMGAGRTETARAIFGADKLESGEIFIHGKAVNITCPADAVANGLGYLSEDRKRYGVITGMSVVENTTMAALDKFCSGVVINKGKEKKVAQEYVDALKTKTPSVFQQLRKLSGGNQQKVVIAKWLTADSEILIFDEPTRGIDVGAKSEIYELMTELVKEGKSIIMISSELTEILRMSDRIVIMCEGRKTGELDISEASQESIMQLATKRN